MTTQRFLIHESNPKPWADTGHICKCGGMIVYYMKEKRVRCVSCRKKKVQENYFRRRSEITAKKRDERRRLKMVVLTAYGGKCKCCGENRFEFLTIDHVNNDGAAFRKEYKSKAVGERFYRWIIRSRFPTDLQLLCMNCNFAKGQYGYCPHEKETTRA